MLSLRIYSKNVYVHVHDAGGTLSMEQAIDDLMMDERRKGERRGGLR